MKSGDDTQEGRLELCMRGECKGCGGCAAHGLRVLAGERRPTALTDGVRPAKDNVTLASVLTNAGSAVAHAISHVIERDVPSQQACGLAPASAEGAHTKTAYAARPQPSEVYQWRGSEHQTGVRVFEHDSQVVRQA